MSTKQSDQIGQLIKRVKAKDFQAFARLLTKVERLGTGSLAYPELLTPQKCAFRVGVTGPPGAGKSTLIGQLIGHFRAKGLLVGVLAVDPSSPFTNGAILGDRIRYSEHFNDEGVFIRSIGSRGSLGGLSASAYLMLRAFDLVGFDVVLIETVGVGQTELEIMHVADLVSVVLVPESGDAIQAMKAGLLEIADQFVVNKSDRPGAGSMVRELEAMVQMGSNLHGKAPVSVMETVATTGQGLPELTQFYIDQIKCGIAKNQRSSQESLRWEARALLRHQYEVGVEKQVVQIDSPESFAHLFNSQKE